MKIVETHDFFNLKALETKTAHQACAEVQTAVQATDWPPGTGKFIIYPESGKKRGKGNGVKLIKNPCLKSLKDDEWLTEKLPKLKGVKVLRTGDLDALKLTDIGYFAFEWETGNISSSHRALNKLFLTMFETNTVGCFLVVPSTNLARYLTDRVGNIRELRPYFPLWHRMQGISGFLRIIVVEQDGESMDVPKIPKGTDGRSLG